MVIPWSALGVDAPAPGAQLRAEIAVTSWHRERWMSLSGHPPAGSVERPEGLARDCGSATARK